MKKTMFTLLAASVLAAGCATTGNTEGATTTSKTITLEQALQKSAETRQKLLEAKQAYQNAQNAAAVAAGTKTADSADMNRFFIRGVTSDNIIYFLEY
jgi:outer membrane receptor protein involved in Fe transport